MINTIRENLWILQKCEREEQSQPLSNLQHRTARPLDQPTRTLPITGLRERCPSKIVRVIFADLLVVEHYWKELFRNP